jgi:hypothetical protein
MAVASGERPIMALADPTALAPGSIFMDVALSSCPRPGRDHHRQQKDTFR